MFGITQRGALDTTPALLCRDTGWTLYFALNLSIITAKTREAPRAGAIERIESAWQKAMV